MAKSPPEGDKESPHGLSEYRVAATICIWGLAAGLAGLVWLSAQHPWLGLPLTHPVNLVLFGICAVIGLGFSAIIWLSRRTR